MTKLKKVAETNWKTLIEIKVEVSKQTGRPVHYEGPIPLWVFLDTLRSGCMVRVTS